MLEELKERYLTWATLGGVGGIALGVGLLLVPFETIKDFIALGLIIYGTYNTFAKK